MNSINNRMKSLTAEVSCGNTNTLSDSFRIYLANLDGIKWTPTVLIVSKGDLNPLNNFVETYSATKSFLDSLNLDIDNCTIYIDLMEFLGIYNPYLFRWEINKNSKSMNNMIHEVTINDLPYSDSAILENYYRDRWSTLKDSCLTTDEKIELIANIFSSTIYDTNSVDNLQISFKSKLIDVLENGTGLLWDKN